MQTKYKTTNLFKDKNTYNIKYVVSIDTEDDLNNLWDYFNNSDRSNYETIQPFMSQFYNFCIIYINSKKSQPFKLVIQQSDLFFYFSLKNKQISSLFKRYLKKTSLEFKNKSNSICIRISKLKYENSINKIDVKNKKRETKLIKSVSNNKTGKVKSPYTFISDEDLDELLKLNDNMQNLVTQLYKVGLNKDIFIPLRSIISLFCLTLRYYDQISPIAITLTKFSNLMNTNKERFMELGQKELELIDGFIYNIDRWLTTLFVKGGANLYFMDNSIKADYETIKNMILQTKDICDDSSLDDIFNF